MIKQRWFVTGDCHGDITKLIKFIHKFNLDENDNIIVLGDMGLAWRKDKQDYNYNIAVYEKECNGVDLYWIDGNHENFDIINNWNCNKNYTFENSPHIHYCPRGYACDIIVENNNKVEVRKALFLGGADSVDKMFRTEHISWWKDETITEKDIKDIEDNYYYIFSHCCPISVFNDNKVYLCTINNINEHNIIHDSENKLEELKNNISYKKWYFGHYHVDRRLDDKHRCIFNDFIELN